MVNKEVKRNRRFKLIMAVRVIAIAIALVNLYLLLTGKFNREDAKQVEEPIISQTSEDTLQREIQPIDSVTNTYAVTGNKQLYKKKSTNKKTMVQVEKVLLHHGIPLENAYFKVANCSSSITGTDGFTVASIPKSIYDTDKEYDFYVYQTDTLVYFKSMRFSDLQFNSYN